MKFIKKIMAFIKSFIQKRKVRKLRKKQEKLKIQEQPMGVSYIDMRKQETSVLDVDLVDDGASKTDKKKVRQYTKCLVTGLTIAACVWISSSYILAAIALVMYGNAEPLSSLSEKVCEVIIGTVIAYSFKSWLESYSAAKHDLDVMKLEQPLYQQTEHEIEYETETINNDEAVG